jgi:hypothetical protein
MQITNSAIKIKCVFEFIDNLRVFHSLRNEIQSLPMDEVSHVGDGKLDD